MLGYQIRNGLLNMTIIEIDILNSLLYPFIIHPSVYFVPDHHNDLFDGQLYQRHHQHYCQYTLHYILGILLPLFLALNIVKSNDTNSYSQHHHWQCQRIVPISFQFLILLFYADTQISMECKRSGQMVVAEKWHILWVYKRFT